MAQKIKEDHIRRLEFKKGVYGVAVNAALKTIDTKRLRWLDEQLRPQRLGWYYDPTDDKAHIITVTEYTAQRLAGNAPWMIDINTERLDAHFTIGQRNEN